MKNEENIVADSLSHAAKYCDEIFVVDTASTDRIWEILRELDIKNLVLKSIDVPLTIEEMLGQNGFERPGMYTDAAFEMVMY